MTHRPLVRSMVTYVHGVACPLLLPSGTCPAWRFQPHTVPALLSNCFSLPRPGCAWHKFLDRTSYDEAPEWLTACWLAGCLGCARGLCAPPGKLKQCYHIHDACGSEQCVVVTYRRNLLLVRVLWRMLCQVLLRVMHMCYQSRHARPKRGAARRVAYTMRQGGRGHGKAYEKTRRSHNKSRSQGRARREQWARIHEPHAT